MRLSECQKGRSQNLHFVRFLAALGVMFGHAFPIATGNSNSEWIIKLTNGQLSFGLLAVSIFFFFGGMLIAKSMERLKTAKAYFKARVIRIFPPLIFVNVCVVLLGGLFSTYAPKQYFLLADTWKYLLNSIFILIHNLPGVFTNNPYLPTINGSLWTLPIEFLCYIVCFIIFKMECMNKKRFWFTIPMAIFAFFMIWELSCKVPILSSMIRPCLLFYIGIAYWVFREQIALKTEWAVIAIIGFILTIILNIANVGLVVFFPYIMSVVCFGIKQVPLYLGRLGNYSYGIYLWGFPVQQAVVYYMGGKMSPYLNMVIATPITIALGILTYVIMEKNFEISRRE